MSGRHATAALGGHRTARAEHAEAVAKHAALRAAVDRPPEPCPCWECRERPAPRHQLVCAVDGHPMGLECQCRHGHDRHLGAPGYVSCLSYTGQRDCPCDAFRPATYPAGVVSA